MSAGSSSFLRTLSILVVFAGLVPASAAAQLRSRQLMTVALDAPTGVVVSQATNGVAIAWQPVANAVQFEILRGPDSTSAGLMIGAVAGSVLTFTDANNTAAAGYRVVAVAADGRRSASAIVVYTPPLRTISTLQTVDPNATKLDVVRASAYPTRQAPPGSTPPPAPAPVRKITGVSATMVRAGSAISITGVGLAEATGAYFGSGAPGSPMNPLITVGRKSDTSVEILTPKACNQSGPIMLEIPGNPPAQVTPDTAITIHCFAATPSGQIANVNSQGVFNLANTGYITITGTSLRAVTNVVDNLGRRYQPTYQVTGSSESLVFSPGLSFSPGQTLTFTLENVLTNPVQAGQVTGSVFMLQPPIVDSITPLWAEPGQKVKIVGQLLNAGGTPQVAINGRPAQLLWTSPTVIEARVSTQATYVGNYHYSQQQIPDTVVVTNPTGRIVLVGPIQRDDGSVQPAFFLVQGPSTITRINSYGTPQPGDTIRVEGRNLARLMGICVVRPARNDAPGYTAILYRVDQQMGRQTSNTEMDVVLQDPYLDVRGGYVVPFAPTQPVGDLPPSQFACGGSSGSHAPSTVQFP